MASEKDAKRANYFGISASLDMSPYCFIENGRTVGTPDVEAPRDMTLFMNQSPHVPANNAWPCATCSRNWRFSGILKP